MVDYKRDGDSLSNQAPQDLGMTPIDKDTIISSFSKRDRRRLDIPNISGIDWRNRDFLAWSDRNKRLWFVVYDLLGEYHGLLLERSKPVGHTVKQCSWCLTVNSGNDIVLFSTRHATNHEVSVGDYFCADLDCSDYIRNLKTPNGSSFTEYPALSVERKVERLKTNMDQFFFRALF